MTTSRDTLFADPLGDISAFAFDENVAQVFPDMIKRSVPGYATIVSMTGLMAGKYAQERTQLYDLGCSLGASTLAMRQNVTASGCQITSVDNSQAMLDRCLSVIETDTQEALIKEGVKTPVNLVCSNLEDVNIRNASVVVLNFTLQFIALKQRDKVVQAIFDGLAPGGIMVLSEKVMFEDPHLDQLNIDLHHQFKRANGYSDMEISGKRSALENVLIPETLAAHKTRIANAGFSSCDVWFQCFNFASLVAIK